MKKLNQILMKCELILGVVLLFALFVIITANMLSRYLLNRPLFWADELSGLIYVWATFLSCAFIMAKDGHIRIQVLEDHFSPKLKLVLRFIVNLATAAVFIYLIPYTVSTFPTLGKSMSMRFPLRYVYTILPVSFGLFAFHALFNAGVECKRLIAHDYSELHLGDE